MKGLSIIELEVSRDARGWNTHPLDETALRDGKFANVHIVSMEPGAIRGNHRHGRQTEHVLIVGGPTLLAVEDEDTGERFERIFYSHEQFRLTFEPGIAHAFKNIGEGAVYLLCASDLAFNPDSPDTERAALIE
ncbi:MAG: hypothetical protein WCX65_01155 [bacterium]